MADLATFDFSRSPDSPLNASLVDQETGKAVAGRGAWEAAADTMFKHLTKRWPLFRGVALRSG